MTVRTVGRRYTDEQQRRLGVKNFAAKTGRCPVIYAVALHENPAVTKVGMTLNWRNRRQAYERWNLRPSGGIKEERVFRFLEEYVDLKAIEAAILSSLPFPLKFGAEWFIGDIDDVAREVDRFIESTGLSYEIL